MTVEMSHYSMLAFGQYLSETAVRLEAELYSTCSNDKMAIETVKRKYGQLEATKVILKAFTDLYEGDVSKFKKEYLSESDESEQDGDGGESPEDSGN
jgi:cell division protein FtsB